MYKIVVPPTDSFSRVLSLITLIVQSYSVKIKTSTDSHPVNIFCLSIPNILVMVLFWHFLNLERMSQKKRLNDAQFRKRKASTYYGSHKKNSSPTNNHVFRRWIKTLTVTYLKFATTWQGIQVWQAVQHTTLAPVDREKQVSSQGMIRSCVLQFSVVAYAIVWNSIRFKFWCSVKSESKEFKIYAL